MTETYSQGRLDNRPLSEYAAGYDIDGVIFTVMMDLPEREVPDMGIVSSITLSTVEGAPTAQWDPVQFRPSVLEDSLYVPPNTVATTTFYSPGHLTTANLNGCTAVAACYRNENDAVPALLGHYTPLSVQETNQDGGLKINRLVAEFAGQRAMGIAVAYPRFYHSEPPRGKGDVYDPSVYYVDAIVDECKKLPQGSHVVLMPYETSATFAGYQEGSQDGAQIGHIMYVGIKGSGVTEIAWNGHSIPVGKAEGAKAKHMRLARIMNAAEEETARSEYDSPDFMEG